MAIAVVGSAKAITPPATGATSVTVAKPTGVAQGHVMCAWFSGDDAAPSATGPTGWTQLISTGVQSRYQQVWRKVATASEPTSYTFSYAGTAAGGAIIVAFSGVNTTTPEDAVAPTPTQIATRTTTATAPSITTVNPGSMVLSAWTVRDDVTDPNNGTNVSVTPQASMTEYQDLAQIWCSVAVAGELQAAAGASGTKSATASSGSVWTNTTIALRDANPVAPGAGPRELVIPSRVAVLRAANF